MARSKSRFWFRRMLASPLVLGVLVLAVAFLFRGVWRLYFAGRAVALKREETAQELIELTKRQSELTLNIEALSTERGLEAKIREDFPVAKEGEGVINVVPAPGATTSTVEAGVDSWWGRLVKWWKNW